MFTILIINNEDRLLAGIYIHIPFCKQACHYCNFHFSTSLKYRDEMMDSILKEIILQKDFLENAPLDSIYFGGGTPSLLTADEIAKTLDLLHHQYDWSDRIEITLEANPDDINSKKIKALNTAGVNRLSIGIQSFIDRELVFSNRAHNVAESLRAVYVCQDAGISNLSIDLIYGMPESTIDSWQYNIDQALHLDVDHISSYALTVEANTALSNMIKKGMAILPTDEIVSLQYLQLITLLTERGYDHYEISNFAKPEKYAIHNTNYWKSVAYLGIGPSAHSFKSNLRQWNIANNAKYINAINKGIIPAETELISHEDHYNEYIMTRLRTMWGVNKSELLTHFLNHKDDFVHRAKVHIDANHMVFIDGHYKLTTEGRLLADGIAADFFLV